MMLTGCLKRMNAESVVKNTGWVRTGDLTFCDGEKSVHFDRKSLVKMAHRYCDELMRIVAEQKEDSSK